MPEVEPDAETETVDPDGAPSVDAFPTAEEAALASYSAASEAFVVRVEPQGPGRTDVIVDTNPSHPMRAHCFLTDGGWVWGGDIVE